MPECLVRLTRRDAPQKTELDARPTEANCGFSVGRVGRLGGTALAT